MLGILNIEAFICTATTFDGSESWTPGSSDSFNLILTLEIELSLKFTHIIACFKFTVSLFICGPNFNLFLYSQIFNLSSLLTSLLTSNSINSFISSVNDVGSRATTTFIESFGKRALHHCYYCICNCKQVCYPLL